MRRRSHTKTSALPNDEIIDSKSQTNDNACDIKSTVSSCKFSHIKLFKFYSFYSRKSINMGVSHSTARWLAPASFIIDFAAQQYGLFSSPNMQDVHDANLSFWSPRPEFIGAFFFPQQIIQLIWLYRLYKLDGNKSEVEKKEAQTMVDYVPYYAIGNMCIASK
jgi:hypothetical protein